MPSKPKAEKATKSKATKKVAKSTPKPEPVVEEPAHRRHHHRRRRPAGDRAV